MCGRYWIKATDELTEKLRQTFKIPNWVMVPRFNIRAQSGTAGACQR
jgi:hypothetical protein